MKHLLFILLLPMAIVLTQCNSAQNLSNSVETTSHTYMKYVSGAGGGKGVIFTITLKELPDSISVESFVVNGVELPASVRGKEITASAFYPTPEPTMGNPNPEPINPLLFNEDSFKAVLKLEINDKHTSLSVEDFQEKEQPLYP